MGRVFDEIDDGMRTWIAAQRMFFVATAPLAATGHVNLSPKGPIGSLRVLGPRRIAYLDSVGSGAETIAHLRENGRIVVMLCAFEGAPRILRLHGRGAVVFPSDPGFESCLAEGGFAQPAVPETRRAIITVEVTRISTSCGYGVPLMTFESERPHAAEWARKKLAKGEAGDVFRTYQRERNATSIDGLPAVGSDV